MKINLSGYKTYIAGFVAIIVGVLSQIFGWFSIEFNTGLVISGFAVIGVGHKLTKIAPPTELPPPAPSAE